MRVYLGIGANLNPEENIASGLQRLSADVDILRVSPCYRSPAVGFDGPDFINLVAEVDTSLSVGELNTCLKNIEQEYGRVTNAVKYSSRALDIDILLADQMVGLIDGIELPRVDVWRFAFVLRPLLDLAPNAVCPKTGRAFSDYLPAIAAQKITRCSGEWLSFSA